MKIFLAALALAPAVALATVNVNTAQQSELQRVKGIDKAKARSIIHWRAENGSIDNFTELEKVPGMTHEVVERVKPQLAFSGPAYIPPPKKAAEKRKPTTLATR